MEDLIKDMQIVCGKNEEEVIKKYESRILELNNPDISLKFCKNINGANIKAHGQIVLDSNEDELILEFLKEFHKECNLDAFVKYFFNKRNPNYIISIAKIPDINIAVLYKCHDFILDNYLWRLFEELIKIRHINPKGVAKRVIEDVKELDEKIKERNSEPGIFPLDYQNMIVAVGKSVCDDYELVQAIGQIIINHGDKDHNLDYAINLEYSDVIGHAKAYINRYVEDENIKEQEEIPKGASLAVLMFASEMDDQSYNTRMRVPVVFLEKELIKYGDEYYIEKFINNKRFIGRVNRIMYEDWMLSIPNNTEKIVEYLFNYTVSPNRLLLFDDYVNKYGSPKDHAVMIRCINNYYGKDKYGDLIKHHDQVVLDSKDFDANCNCATYMFPDENLDFEAHLEIIKNTPVEDYTEKVADVAKILVRKKRIDDVELITKKVLTSNNIYLLAAYGRVPGIDLIKLYVRLIELKDSEENIIDEFRYKTDYQQHFYHILKVLKEKDGDYNTALDDAKDIITDIIVKEAEERVNTLLMKYKNN